MARRKSHQTWEIEILLTILRRIDHLKEWMEYRMSALDDAVNGLTDEIERVLTEVVEDLQAKLSAAQADDADAALAAADVQENVDKLSALKDHVASFEPAPETPADVPPAEEAPPAEVPVETPVEEAPAVEEPQA